MKHINTTATQVRKIKSAAKRLKLEKKILLAEALDLASIEAGYENYHHVSQCVTQTIKLAPFSLGDLIAVSETYIGKKTILFRTKDNSYLDDERLLDITESLDELVEDVGGGFGDMSLISKPGLREIIKECKKLTKLEPAFLDGYAHWAGALVALNKHEESIAMALPVFNACCELVPKGHLVVYYHLENRPFHRLAFNLALAYEECDNYEASRAIAKKMLSLWPNDNMGFRELLEPPESP